MLYNHQDAAVTAVGSEEQAAGLGSTATDEGLVDELAFTRTVLSRVFLSTSYTLQCQRCGAEQDG